MIGKRLFAFALAPVVVAALVLASPAAAQAPQPPPRLTNGVYYGYYWGTNSSVALTVRNNVITTAAIFTPGFGVPITNGLPPFFFAGSCSTSVTNGAGYPINPNTGAWAVPIIDPGAPEFFVPSLCGLTRPAGYLVVSFNCDGPKGVMTNGTNPLFSAKRGPLPDADGITYTGTSSATPRDPAQANSPFTPWTGPEGSINLSVSGGTITGTGTFAPVDPDTGIPTGGAPVNVTYGPVSFGAQGGSIASGGGASLTTGFIALPSTPAGYSVCGALALNGTINGTVNCTPTPPNFQYVAAQFTLTPSSPPSSS
jgi:hypothetical protein